jgi:asparagine synthase (glutamine-hydrolysing)
MCGIAGSVGSADARGQIRRMISVEAHRGPDGEGLWLDEPFPGRTIAFGHRRLSIIDLSQAASQPMADREERFVVTYNGEIYNYREVRAELARLGVAFRSQSDTEVLLEAYKRWGVDCLERLNGMFAFALFDRPRGKLFCARDRFGEKPFLYAFGPDLFAFASEYKSLLQHPAVSLEYDERRLVRAAHNPGTALDGDRQTVFNQVRQLLPGEAMEVDVRSLEHKVWRYWRIEAAPVRRDLPEAEAFAQFRSLLTDSVRIRMRSDVPLGSCLSGGLDSSSIVCLARELVGEDADYHTFTGRFPGTSADEWRYAEEVATHARVTTHCVEPTVDGFLEELPEFMWHNELPVGGSSQYAQWCVFRLARQCGVTVLLDGQGADELLGGYEQYFIRYVEALRENDEGRRLAEELPRIRERYPLALVPPARGLRDRLPLSVRHWLSGRLGVGTSILYGMSLRSASEVARENELPRKPGFGALANALEQDSFGRYLTTLLRYGDRNSMAHSREVRLPFCDHRIAEFVFSLPSHFLMGEVQTKRLLRESMKGVLPEAVRTRWNKQGFRPPQELWFQSPRMIAAVHDAIESPEFEQGGHWSRAWWRKALARVERGDRGLASTLWHPFMVVQWKRRFLHRLRQSRSRTSVEAA